VKLASELQKRSTGRTIYVLDEPTTGLHFEDVAKLLAVLQSLVDKGNSVMVIEHNLDVIKTADWVIDMGPEGGSGGGTVVAEGTPEEVAGIKGSYTGQFLAGILADRLASEAASQRPAGKRTPTKQPAGKRAATKPPVGKRAAAKVAAEPVRTVRQPVAAKAAKAPRTSTTTRTSTSTRTAKAISPGASSVGAAQSNGTGQQPRARKAAARGER
jgi:excinuclease ABC subunit A